MRKLLLALLLLLPVGAWAQGSPYNGNVQTALGEAVPGTSVAVCTANPGTATPPCTSTLASIYSNVTLTTVLTNPMTTDSYGRYQFFAAPGTYWLQIYGSKILGTQVIPIILAGSGGGSVSSVGTGTGLTGGPINTSGTISLVVPVAIANGGTGTATPALVAGANIAITGTWPNNTIAFSGTLPVANGGTGQVTTTLAFNALAPPASANALLYTTGANTWGALSAGGAGTLCLLEISGGPPQWGGCTGSSSTVWSALSGAIANLVLANAGFTTTFQQTSAVNWIWTNTTAATSTTSQNSPLLNAQGEYWNGTASAPDTWAMQDVVGNGTNGTSTLTFSHTGSTGAAAVLIPTLSLTNALSIANGGSGQTTAAAAFNALAPATATGGLIIGTGTNAYGNLAVGPVNDCLVSNGTTWVAGVCTAGSITGSGTVNSLAKFTSASAIGNSTLVDNGTTVSSGESISVTGTATLSSYLSLTEFATSPAGVIGADLIWGDSNIHWPVIQVNGAAGFNAIAVVAGAGVTSDCANWLLSYTLQDAGFPCLKGSAGTTNAIAKFTGTNILGNSALTDNGTTITSTEEIQLTGTSYPNLDHEPVTYTAFAPAGVIKPNAGAWQIFRGTTASPIPATGNIGAQDIFSEIVGDSTLTTTNPSTSPAAIRAYAIQAAGSANTFALDAICQANTGTVSPGTGCDAIHAAAYANTATSDNFAAWFQVFDDGLAALSTGMEIDTDYTAASRTYGQERGANIVNVPGSGTTTGSNGDISNDWGLLIEAYGNGLVLSPGTDAQVPYTASTRNLIRVRGTGSVTANSHTTVLSFESQAGPLSLGLDLSNATFSNAALKTGQADIVQVGKIGRAPGGSNTNLVGTITVSAATSASTTFTNAYTNAPFCFLTPSFNLGTTAMWVSTTTTAVTANFSAATTGTVWYGCIANVN